MPHRTDSLKSVDPRRGFKPEAFTPEPWDVFPSDDPKWVLVMSGGKAGRIVANVNVESCPDTSSAPAFVKMPAMANARLIALAPRLLAACRACVNTFCDNDETTREEYAAIEAAAAAIAELEGKQETTPAIKRRLEYLRGELRAERISYGELHELQSLKPHIAPEDVELLEAAGIDR